MKTAYCPKCQMTVCINEVVDPYTESGDVVTTRNYCAVCNMLISSDKQSRDNSQKGNNDKA